MAFDEGVGGGIGVFAYNADIFAFDTFGITVAFSVFFEVAGFGLDLGVSVVLEELSRSLGVGEIELHQFIDGVELFDIEVPN